jgi:arylsulfatase
MLKRDTQKSGKRRSQQLARWLVAATAMAVCGTAYAAPDRSSLPIAPPPFDGKIAENALDATPGTPFRVVAPEGAPNILLFMGDDVGYAMSSAFGGPVPTPNMERLARQGQRYNRFHTTGICSPTRAALLTGRNHHNSGGGFLADSPTQFPGYTGRISRETATIAQMLRLNGYNTAMFGKHHNVPAGETTAAGPFDRWPTGLGFEYFFGFIGADSDQFDPPLYRGIQRVDPTRGADADDGALLDKRLADDIIDYVHNQKAATPDKPFFIYFAPGSTHAPHQAPPEYIARFKGRFDIGWDRMREETFRRQIAMGIVPRDAKLTPRPAEIPAWSTLSAPMRAFAARAMEVAAAQLAYQDEQLGRVLDELDRMGLSGNTLVAVIQGDNGASADGGPDGTINEVKTLLGQPDDPAWLIANTDRLGGRFTYETYPAGWAWAMDTPYRWTKQNAAMLGGIRNGAIVSWPGHVAHQGAICAEFGHVTDIAPTLMAAAGLPTPTSVDGVRQKPFDGQSLLPSLTACKPDRPRTQYFELGGKIGLYHDGWFASHDDGRPPWVLDAPAGGRPQVRWTLYDLRKDFSQSEDVAARHPERLRAMLALWDSEARRNNVYPIDYRIAQMRHDRSATLRQRFEYWGKNISVPAVSGPAWPGRSYTLEADVVLAKPEASGVVLAAGSHFAGLSLFLDKGRPTFVYARSTKPDEIFRIASGRALPAGKSRLRLRFDARGFLNGGTVTLSADGGELASGTVGASFLTTAGPIETVDIGRDLGVPVTEYAVPHGVLDGDVPHLTLTFD